MVRTGVLLPIAFPGLLTYTVPESMTPPRAGCRVIVPFGNQVRAGIVADTNPPPAPEGVEERSLLGISDEEPFLPPSLVSTLMGAANHYFVGPGEMIRAAVPSRLLDLGETTFTAVAPAGEAAGLSEAEKSVLETLQRLGRSSLSQLRDGVKEKRVASILKKLALSGLVRMDSAIPKPPAPSSEPAWTVLDPSRLMDIPPRKKIWKRVCESILKKGGASTLSELRPSGATLRILVDLEAQGVVTRTERALRADLVLHTGTLSEVATIVPTDAQRAAIREIEMALRQGTERTLLLDGVTGSGKTEVYLAAIEACRALGKAAILLVPEIALAPGVVRRILGRLGSRISLLHSALSDKERAIEWERARTGEADIVVGPRSAVFAPLANLGLIVIDEAHEGAYKQGESPRYDARDVARSRSRACGAVVVLGSATPVMEHERPAREGRLPRLTLPARPGTRTRAAVEVVDIRKEPIRRGEQGKILLAGRTVEILSGAFEKGEQAIVLLNRRGFSPSLLCRPCGEDFRCVNCSVARTYHRKGERLLCHYCGDFIPRPDTCPRCGSDALMPIGFGTERLAERFAETFPGIPYAVLDRDTASRRGGAAAVLMDFETGRAKALLGTQMVAKGHDFPNATALAVLDADALLSFPDFRCAERTFQLVTQAAGRVGRGDRPGVVAVQTARPEHEAIQAAISQDHPRFSEMELRFRRTFQYPPYSYLLLALWANEDLREAELGAREGRVLLDTPALKEQCRILGPAPAPIERLKGEYRFHILIKSQNRKALLSAGYRLLQSARPPRLDMDPQNML